MQKLKNNFITGVLAGAVLPATTWLFFGCLFSNIVFMHKPGIPYFVAIAINLIGVRYGFRNDMDKTATGIIVITFIVMILLFVLKIQPAA